MGGRRRSSSELPHAPLELTHPLSICAADIPGTELLRELPPQVAPAALRLLRVVLAWSRDPAGAARALDTSALARPERDGSPLPEPLADLAAALSPLSEALPNAVALAALGVCDWALDEGAECAALAFAEAAALAWPRNARLAWVVGRLHRSRGRMRDAERWLKRSHRVAVWTDDWESQARTLNSLGNLHHALGRFGASKETHGRALQIAERRAMRSLEGEVRHDLFVVYAETKDWQNAEAFARAAMESYLPAHPRLPYLVSDVAQSWNDRGHYQRALPLFRSLSCVLTEPGDRLRVVAGLARAAGGVGDRGEYERNSALAWRLAKEVKQPRAIAAALAEVGFGAVELCLPDQAVRALERAIELAQGCGAADVSVRASEALEKLAAGATRTSSTRCHGGSPDSSDALAYDLLNSITGFPAAAELCMAASA